MTKGKMVFTGNFLEFLLMTYLLLIFHIYARNHRNLLDILGGKVLHYCPVKTRIISIACLPCHFPGFGRHPENPCPAGFSRTK